MLRLHRISPYDNSDLEDSLKSCSQLHYCWPNSSIKRRYITGLFVYCRLQSHWSNSKPKLTKLHKIGCFPSSNSTTINAINFSLHIFAFSPNLCWKAKIWKTCFCLSRTYAHGLFMAHPMSLVPPIYNWLNKASIRSTDEQFTPLIHKPNTWLFIDYLV